MRRAFLCTKKPTRKHAKEKCVINEDGKRRRGELGPTSHRLRRPLFSLFSGGISPLTLISLGHASSFQELGLKGLKMAQREKIGM